MTRSFRGTRLRLVATHEFAKGLHEIADGVFAYLQPDGGWGWSNAGLITADNESLLVDTLFDLRLTNDMLDSMSGPLNGRPIKTLVNTHANGDHCFGNQLVEGATVIASEASAAEMEDLPPAALAAMMRLDLGATTNQYLLDSFGAFSFDDIEPPSIDQTFTGSLDLQVGERTVQLLEVGPAHTAGDVLVHLPETATIFTGDILFIEGTPIVWNGPVQNWLDACDRIIDLGASTIVPGHGPLTDAAGVRQVADYLCFLRSEATTRWASGMSATEAARDIDLGSYYDWLDWERIAINVDSMYRELDPNHESADVLALFTTMAELKASRNG